MSLWEWFENNLIQLIISGIAILVGWIVNYIIGKQIDRTLGKDSEKEGQATSLKRVIKFLIIIIVLSIVISQFSESTGAIAQVLALMSGTVIGFAAMNTLGNALAGMIIMIIKPIQKGDRIDFDGRIADVKRIEFIYTKLKYLDGTIISIPNQEFLKNSILNYTKSEINISRKVAITLDYEAKPEIVMNDLIEVTKSVEGVLSDPAPSAIVSGLLDYAVEYSCFYKINDVKLIPGIDSKVRLAVLQMCQEKGYDLTMPILHKNV